MNPAELLTNHTYRMMLLGTVIIGFTTGAIGTFAYLRKRTLLADVVSHSSIGGVMLASSLPHPSGSTVAATGC